MMSAATVKLIAQQTAIDLLTWGLMYACFWLNIEGAGNVLLFLTWWGFGVSLIVNAAASSKKKTPAIMDSLRKLQRPQWHRQRVMFTSYVEGCVFIWFGWWWTGFVYVVSSLLLQAARSNIDKLPGMEGYRVRTADEVILP